jgi:hypothetical protein
MFYWPPFKAGPREMDVPELEGMPPRQLRRIADACMFRAYFSWTMAGFVVAILVYFLCAGHVIELVLRGAPTFELLAYPLAFVGGILAAPILFRRVRMWQYRREVRACLDGHEPSLW